MLNDPKVLIIEADKENGKELQAVLKFINQSPIYVGDCSQWQDVLEGAGDILAVMVGSCKAERMLTALLNEIHQYNEHLPIYLLAEKGKEPTVTIDTGSCILGRLDIPPNYAQLTSAMHQAEVYAESHRGAGLAQRPVGLFRSLVGSSRAIQNVRKMIEQVADSEANVLILGESGTGKEVVARNLHYHSSRRGRPFVPVNCGAIPGDLLESELFGHEKGAFTGAISAREGRFEMAEGGTLFLDEIGDMSLAMQIKILRVLQERTFERVGSNNSITSNVRIIAATHRDLESAIIEGEFREDLFYRLNVFPIEMPPLRVRVEDIPLLVNELVRRIEHEKRGSVRLSPGAIYALCQYNWPGNVRELANLIERLAILHPYGVVEASDLPDKFRIDDEELDPELLGDALIGSPVTSHDLDPRLPRDGLNLKEHLSSLEINYIKQALEDSGGVVAHAAKRLGMRRTTLVEKLRKYRLQRTPTAS
ncbi:MAG: sigma-54 dependent transcriptional regulator [Gammaproteobacteria bacterium]|nr:sigma-54 dependent transcriptional regulator [Gammaproteobacteria bacterium]MDH3559458.1 sigma-54 dependent transcriptional regulator [Gammaproteobacteria bacterium]